MVGKRLFRRGISIRDAEPPVRGADAVAIIGTAREIVVKNGGPQGIPARLLGRTGLPEGAQPIRVDVRGKNVAIIESADMVNVEGDLLVPRPRKTAAERKAERIIKTFPEEVLFFMKTQARLRREILFAERPPRDMLFVRGEYEKRGAGIIGAYIVHDTPAFGLVRRDPVCFDILGYRVAIRVEGVAATDYFEGWDTELDILVRDNADLHSFIRDIKTGFGGILGRHAYISAVEERMLNPLRGE